MFLLTFAPARAGHSPPKIFLRVFIQTQRRDAGDRGPARDDPAQYETIQVRTLPEVTEQDLVAVETDPSGAVHLHLNHRGQVNLDAVTGQYQGRILVVTINGYVVYAPIVDQQLTEGELILPHPLPADVIRLLQETARRNVEDSKRA